MKYWLNPIACDSLKVEFWLSVKLTWFMKISDFKWLIQCQNESCRMHSQELILKNLWKVNSAPWDLENIAGHYSDIIELTDFNETAFNYFCLERNEAVIAWLFRQTYLTEYSSVKLNIQNLTMILATSVT